MQAPAAHRSTVVQARPSSQEPPLVPVWAHAPLPLQASSVHALSSLEHGVPAASAQLSSGSLHESLHSVPPAQGLPAPTQPPLTHASVNVQNNPSLHGEPFRSAAVQLSAL